MNRLVIAFLLISGGAICGPAAAQNESQRSSERGAIEEIVVTASKRGEQNLQDLPMSITAIGEDRLEALGADDMVDYLTMVPGLSYRLTSATGGRDDIRGGRRLNIRGIESGPDGIPTTAFYLDDTPMPIMDPKLFDIARVEVLRGPQGTLFGANSMGGTVRIVTNKPRVDEIEYKADTTFGFTPKGENIFHINGMLNAPIVENRAALRAVIFHRTEDGFIDVVDGSDLVAPAVGSILTASDVNDEETSGARIALTWLPTDNLTITPSIFYQRIGIDDSPEYAPSVGDLMIPDCTICTTDTRVVEQQENEFTLSSVELSYNFGDIELFSSTGYSDSSVFTVDDFSDTFVRMNWVPDPFVRGFQDISTERFSSELRLSYSASEKWNWVAGLFYMDEDRLFEQDVPKEGLDWCTEDLCGADFMESDTVFTGVQTNSDKQISLFGEASYSVTEAWEITAGLRWFDDEQDQLVVFDGWLNGGFLLTEGAASASEVSPKLQVSFHASDDVMFYGLAAKGFRPGGPTNLVPTSCAEDLAELGLSEPLSQFEADTLWNYEVGVKSSFSDGRYTLNATTFVMDWTDVQNAVRLACGFGFVGNVGAAESKGVEVEFSAHPTDNFNVFGSFGYINAEFTETSTETGVTAGDKVTNTPETTATIAAQYLFPVTDGVQAYIEGSYQFMDEIIDPTTSRGTPVRPAYSTADLRFGLIRDSWEVVFFVKNLTDERGLLFESINQAPNALPMIPTTVGVIRPRTFGITLRFNGGG